MRAPTGMDGKLPAIDKTAVAVVAKDIADIREVAAGLQSGLLGSAVENLEVIKQVGAVTGDITTVAAIATYLPQLTANLDNLETVVANLAPILNCSNNMATLLLLHARMAELEQIIPQLPAIERLHELEEELVSIYEIIPQIVTLVAHMQDVFDVAQALPQLTIVFENLAELVALGQFIDEIKLVAENLEELLKVNGLVEEARNVLDAVRHIEMNVQQLKVDTLVLKNAAKKSADDAKDSELAAYAHKLSAAASAVDAKASEDAAEVAEQNSVAASESSYDYSELARLSANAAEESRGEAEDEANRSEVAANASQVSADRALVSETNAKASENAAKTSEVNAKTSETKAKTSETNAKASEMVAVTKAGEASASASAANTSAVNAANSATAANTAKEVAEEAAASIVGGIVDRGAWDASGGVFPAKPARPLPGGGTAPISAFWKVTVAGTVGGISFAVGDDLRYSASTDTFYKVDNTDAVTSVQGKLGAVTLSAAEVFALGTPSGTHATDTVLVAGATAGTSKHSGYTIQTSVPAGAIFTDTVYTHPTTDGNKHVPATGTTNNRKVLMAGDTAGSASWQAPLITDVSGLPAALNGKLAVDGNAVTASKLQNPVTINGVTFDGSANITVTAGNPTTLTRGTGLTGANYNGSAATTWAVAYGSAAGTAAQGNDPRLSDARTPLAHTHTPSEAGALPANGSQFASFNLADWGMRTKVYNHFDNGTDWNFNYAGFIRTNGKADGKGNSMPALLIWCPHSGSNKEGNYGFGIGSDYSGAGLYYYSRNDDGSASYKNKIYHENFRPSATDVGAVSKSGDTMDGALSIRKAHGITLDLTATDGGQSPATTAVLNITGYGGRAKGTYLKDSTVAGTWFTGVPYSATHSKYSISFSADGTKPEYPDKALFTVNSDGVLLAGTNKIYHEGFNPTADDVGALPLTGGTVTGKAKFESGINVVANSANPFRWCRADASQEGQDDNVTVVLEDSEISFIHNNDDDGDGSIFTFRYTSNGIAQTLLGFSTAAINYKGHKIYHAGDKPTAADVGALAITGGTVTGSVHAQSFAVPANNYFNFNSAAVGLGWGVVERSSNGYLEFATREGTGAYTVKAQFTLNGELHLVDGSKRVYHQGFKPTAADVGAIPVNNARGTPVALLWGDPAVNAVGTKIRLPFAASDRQMLSFVVRVYQNYQTHDIQFSGYLYSTPNNWAEPRAIMIAGSSSIDWAMGRDDDGRAYIWIAGNNFRGIGVFDVVCAYRNGDTNTGWSASISDVKPNIAAQGTAHPPYSPHNKPTAADIGALPISGGALAGNVTAFADRRVKDNIRNIPNALEKVLKLNGVTYTRTDQEDKEKLHTGVIAQEVEAVLPEAVHASENRGIKDFKSVAYGNLVGLLIEAIKEQQAQIEELKELKAVLTAKTL